MQKIIVANWKMYLNRKNSLEFLRNIKYSILNIQLIICPSFDVLAEIAESKPRGVEIGAQDCFWAERGAYTGEISPVDLKELGCEYVIIGHSERRNYLKETDEMINQKVKAALGADLTPILCVGESKAEREKGQAVVRVKVQLEKDLKDISFKQNQQIIIAYEPIWAIGTGDFCDPQEAVKMHCLIKKEADHLLSVKNIPVLYGGSVDDKNVAAYLEHPEIDGVLVGGASTKLEVFTSLLRNAANLKS